MENEIKTISPINEIKEISDSTKNEIGEISEIREITDSPKNEIKLITDSMTPVDSMDYRGIHVDFFDDPYGHQVFTKWSDSIVGFGAFNTQYREDMKLLIDEHLDVIKRFTKPYRGAKLTWFTNGDHRDIHLAYRGRILKVFLVADESDVTETTITKLIDESVCIMKKLRIGES